MIVRIINLYHTSTEWASKNPILEEATIGIESDTNLSKIGDGKTSWNELPYAGGAGQKYFVLGYGYVPKVSVNNNHRGFFV